ncbi:MAG: hypothetical protein EPN25_08540 [Nitrospirae bacterium]|nr:MAG: hypothetical protein EPN25_08540 [Nitrospirota bacterium]
MFDREPYEDSISFTVLYMQEADFRREDSSGKVIDKSSAGLGMLTGFPLEPGHILEWDDKHQEGKLHIAMVRWAIQMDDCFRVGLMFI